MRLNAALFRWRLKQIRDVQDTGAVIEWLPIWLNYTIVETEYYAIEGVIMYYNNTFLEQQLGKIYLN